MVHRTITVITVLCLVLAGVLAVIVPMAAAKEYENTKIRNNDFWSKKIEDPKEEKEGDMDFEIFVDEINGKKFDVYILESAEFEKYSANKTFTAKFSMENINSTGQINFSTHPDLPDFYLVVDNRDNIHAGDAYANDTISVDISMERAKDDGIIFCIICGGLIFLAVVAIIVIIVWIIVERKRPPKPFETFEPLRNPPLAKTKKREKSTTKNKSKMK